MTTDNALCNFVTTDGRDYICTRCGLILRSINGETIPPVFVCQGPSMNTEEEKSLPSFTERLKNFAQSTVDHIKHGMKLCTDEQIAKRLDICKGCEYYQNETCTKCGCPLVRHRKYISKLAWAEQECPIGKWGKEI